MRLYTEEQVKKVIIFLTRNEYSEEIVKDIINDLTPIELPSEEEIEARARGFTDYPYGQAGFIRGCQWVIEQIK